MSTTPTNTPSPPRSTRLSAQAKYTLSGALIAGALAIPITRELIRDDPSSTAVLGYFVTVPFAAVIGLVIGLIISAIVQFRSS